MLKRKAYNKLLDWKKRGGRTSLLIEGARRVGKTTLVQEFARNEYATSLYLDFTQISPDIIKLFERLRHDVPAFLNSLQAITGTRLKERDALVIFDEVQNLPIARSFTKHLVADGRFDYITTGSLISIRENVRDILIPSEESRMELFPMDFEEWLWANDRSGMIEPLVHEAYDTRKPLDDTIHRVAMRHFREYFLVGGMPQAVNAFIEEKDFLAADDEKRAILALYREDMRKYGSSDATKAAAIFNEIPGQLSKHEKRFTLASLGERARYREYAGAVFWIGDSRIANIARNSTDPNVGLRLHERANDFKCYLADTGLLMTATFADNAETSSEVYRLVLGGRLGVNEGMLTENYVAQQLRASGHELFYYSRRDDAHRENTMEIDFLLIKGFGDAAFKPRVSPIEVKSTNRYSTRSLDKFRARFGKHVGTEYVLHPRQLVDEGKRLYLPLYMAHLL